MGLEIDFDAYRSFLSKSPDERKVLCLLGDPQALAYTWIEAYAENLSDQASGDTYNDAAISVDELLETSLSHLGEGWGDYIVRGGSFEGESVDPTFWDKLSILLGVPIPSNKRSSLLSCSC